MKANIVQHSWGLISTNNTNIYNIYIYIYIHTHTHTYTLLFTYASKCNNVNNSLTYNPQVVGLECDAVQFGE